MCKTGRKKKKKIFGSTRRFENFILFFYFYFCGFTVSRTNEKKNVQGRSWMGYCPFSNFGCNTVDCIAIGKGVGALQGAIRPSRRARARNRALRHGT